MPQWLPLWETTWIRCVSASCASSTIAVAHGAGLIESGRAAAVLVCCGDLITEYAFAGFSALKALSPFPCRPFDRDLVSWRPQ